MSTQRLFIIVLFFLCIQYLNKTWRGGGYVSVLVALFFFRFFSFLMIIDTGKKRNQFSIMFWSLGSILVLCNIRSERNDVEMWYWWYMASVEAFSMFIIAANVCLLLMTYISILCLHRVTVQFFTFQDWVVTHEKHRLSLAKKCIN